MGSTEISSAQPTGGSLLVRILLTIVFLGIGFAFSVFCLEHAPSFWYVPASVLLLIGGFLWFRPRTAASFSLPLTLSLLLMMLTLSPWRWQGNRMPGMMAIFVLLIATAICISQIRQHGVAQRALAIVAVLLIVSLAVDRGFTNRVETRGFDMSWTSDGVDAVGDPAATNSRGEKPVIVFLKVGGGFCYDAIFSDELRKRLTSEHKPLVHVVYNEFSNFGHNSGYNLHSVEGMIFNEGRKVVVSNPEGYGGILLAGASNDSSTDASSSCPR